MSTTPRAWRTCCAPAWASLPTDDPGRGRRAADEHLLGAREGAGEGVLAARRVAALKALRPEVIIGVGGCVASQEGEAITARAPFVDLVFGPQTLHRLPQMIGRAAAHGRAVVDVSFPEIEKFDHLPEPRARGRARLRVGHGRLQQVLQLLRRALHARRGSQPCRSSRCSRKCAQLAAQGVGEITAARAERQRLRRCHGRWRGGRSRDADSSRRARLPASSASDSPPRTRSSSTTA